jgi:hypothetical protein
MTWELAFIARRKNNCQPIKRHCRPHCIREYLILSGNQARTPAILTRLENYSHHLMALFTFLVSSYFLFWGEKWGWYKGMGMPPWSGWLEQLALPQLDMYHIQRCLPPYLLINIFKIFHIDPTPRNIVLGFGFFNLALITSIPYIWSGVCRELKISVLGKWFGFVALIINYAAVKWSFYYTTNIGDTWSYFSGIALLYFWLRSNTIGLLITTIALAFTWPTCLHIGCVLIAFPRESQETVTPPRYRLNLIMAGAITFGVLCFLYNGRYVQALWSGPAFRHAEATAVIYSATEPLLRAIKLSYLIVAAIVFFSFYYALNSARLFNLAWIKQFKQPRNLFRLALGLGVYLVVRWVQRAYSNKSDPVTVSLFMNWSFANGLTAPGLSLICQTFFYGPLVLLALCKWRTVANAFHENGRALTFCLIFFCLFIPNAEARQLGNVYTFIVPFVILAVETLSLTFAHLCLFTVLSILASKMWLNWEPKYAEYSPIYNAVVFLPDYWYIIHLCAALALLLVLYFFFVSPARHVVFPRDDTDRDSSPQKDAVDRRIIPSLTSNAKFWITTAGVVIACLFWLILRIPSPLAFMEDSDWGHQLAGANQILHGEHPFIDFRATYGPLTFYLSALAQILSGTRPGAEVFLCVAGFLIGYIILFLMCWKASGRRAVAFAVITVALIALPRLYKYYIVLCPAVMLFLAWRYLDFPTRPKLWALAASVAVAGLFRPDFGAYTFITAIVAVWLSSHSQRTFKFRELLCFAGAVVTCASPWLIWASINGALLRYLKDSSLGSANLAAGSSLPFPQFTLSEGLSNGNVTFILFAFFYLIPIISAWFAHRTPDIAERRKVYVTTVLAIGTLMQAAHRSEILHLLQAIPITFVLVAWLAGKAMDGLRDKANNQALPVAGLAIIALCAPLLSLQVWRLGNIPSPENLKYVRQYTRSRENFVIQAATDNPDHWLTKTLHDVQAHTKPEQRIMAIPLLMNVYYFAGRPFAGNQMAVIPGFFSDTQDQQIMLDCLAKQYVPLVIDIPGFVLDMREDRRARMVAPLIYKFCDEQFVLYRRIGPVVLLMRPDLLSKALESMLEPGLVNRYQLGSPLLQIDENSVAAIVPLNSQISKSAGKLVVSAAISDPQLILPVVFLPQEQSLILRIDITAPSDTFTQIFFLKGDNVAYSEPNSVVCQLSHGRNILMCEVPGFQTGTKLRLDPGAVSGDYVIHSISLRTVPRK